MTDETAKELIMQLARIAEALESIEDNINEVVYADNRGQKHLRIDGFMDVRKVN